MKRVIVMIAAASVLVASCVQDNSFKEDQEVTVPLEDDIQMAEVSFDLSVDNGFLNPDGTRTSLEDGRSVVWEKGDQVGAVFRYGTSCYVQTFSLKDDSQAGKSTATFTGLLPLGYTGYISFFYPYSDISKQLRVYSSGIVTPIVNVPDTQTYRESNVASGANLSMEIYNLTTPGESGWNNLNMELNLKNVGGILRLNLTGDKKVRKIVLTSNDGFLNGTLVVNPSTYELEDTGNSSAELTLDCGEDGVQLSEESTQFNMVIPSGRLSSGFTVTIYDTDGGVMNKTAKASSGNLVSRNTILNMPSFAYDPLPSYAATVVEPGFYSNPAGALTSDFSFVSSGRQCIADADGCHVQNWTGSSSVRYTLPSNLEKGGSYDIGMTAEIGTPESGHSPLSNVKFTGSFNNLAFFESSDGSKLYVFSIL